MNHRIVFPAMFAILLPLAAFPAAPRQQSSNAPSVAEAARRSREMKKDQAKPARVVTDDDVASIKGTISVVGPASAAPAAPGNAAAAPGEAAKPADSAKSEKIPGGKDEAGWRALFAAAHKTLSEDARELDLLQREFNLKQQQYYSDPNVALREQTGRKDLGDTQKQIDDKKAAVDKDKQYIADLEDGLRKAGGDSGWAQEGAALPVPAQPPSDAKPSTP